MSRPAIYFAVTSHGFGHAVRAASVVAKIQQLDPDILIILVTTAPRWLLESYIPGDFIQRPRAFDVGVIQADSINMDKAATLAKLQEIRQQQNTIIASEVNYIRTNKVKLVLADIPFLAAPIARLAGIPSWMMSNFGWDFIYRDWGEEFGEIADWIGECYGQSDLLFRLPLHEPMSAFPKIADVGLTGGTPRFSREELQKTFNLKASPERTILLTFGGLGLQQIPYHNLQNFPDWQFITFDRKAPDLPNLIKVMKNDYRPVDFMPFCDRVLSKPGYSTFAEALRLKIPLISLRREGFAESPLLIEGMQNYAEHLVLAPEEFFRGNWDFLRQPLQPPRKTASLPGDGTETIARAVVDYCHNSL
ncbi:glycosyl transferase [Lusitaniella coriacea]|uniref:glycosyl transferase n=1 Tax=Lusitaniella coriacea TaxID=1983105 RepID=UPI003CE90AC4